MSHNNNYCNSLVKYNRRKSSVVQVGNIPLGGDYPIRVQSMTTTNTMDTEATIKQSIKMIDAGSEYVRITAPSIKDARNLENIKNGLIKAGYDTPIIADIHFTPNAAMEAAKIVEKVRINPGNFVDRKKFEHIEYSDKSYDDELVRIRERFLPLVQICKEYGTAMRIGSNHGSLSDRILSRYGDTPLGMVESALEFVRICDSLNFHEIVLSMKASNTRVMVQAYRLLINCMDKENMNYPLHLGVTEAGEGEDGRIKSAVGIGTLLEDGLGDTIRVSLTEAPELEIPVAKLLVKRYEKRNNHDEISVVDKHSLTPFEYKKRVTHAINNIGGDNVPIVIADLSKKQKLNKELFFDLGYVYKKNEDKWIIKDMACDYVYLNENKVDFDLPGSLGIIQSYSNWLENNGKNIYPALKINEYLNANIFHEKLNFIHLTIKDISEKLFNKIKDDSTAVIILETDNLHGMAEQRRFFIDWMNRDYLHPIIISRKYSEISLKSFQLFSATDLGGLLVDGLGDGIFIRLNNFQNHKLINDTAFGILQASRTRISKTEYISCPSCGRTLFDLEETTALVRHRTSHLKGIKIGIMGCIVNGPGEMADADYGYVGTGVGKISIYRGQNVIVQNIPAINAVDELIDLMKKDGKWVEPT
ncbi:MAG: (E)-4-hydroxy-3-methylbut-2-enyl-diphosphate synthase [Candidatus Neomarinimicrobiota bacterium]|nr:(E)-4-hydroxy-3-methylbut-2-enyl-diphosphate synthase [Candidatus Neomarinimicrobiota bacterium]